MDSLATFVERHGLPVLFLFVMVEQFGLPLPAAPVMVTVGALSATGHVSLAAAIAVSVAGCMIADWSLFELGRWRGPRLLRLLCRISLEPDSCVRNAENVLATRGAPALLYAKFIPGAATVGPPVAGAIRMRRSRFLVWDTAGAIVWSGLYLGLGWLFGPKIVRVLETVGVAGQRLGVIAAGAFAVYLAGKYFQRHRFLRQIALDRITPEELRRRLDAGERITVIDLRSSSDFEAVAETVPGALRSAPERIDEHLGSVIRDGEVVLFCT
jgi:membrane protein DedA with SNARE-associated domain